MQQNQRKFETDDKTYNKYYPHQVPSWTYIDVSFIAYLILLQVDSASHC